MIITCKGCGKSEELAFVKEMLSKRKSRPDSPGRTKVFIDVRGRKRRGLICPRCVDLRERKRRGHKSLDECNYVPIKTGVKSENTAKTIFESLGFSVERGYGRGPDLYCKIGTMQWTVEVKTASYAARSWRVGRVVPMRKNDDLVAMVLPNGRVYIDEMQCHLSKCMKGGPRTITDIVEKFGTNPLPTSNPTP